jgi:light-regulated signal transduction histidine kinase (bacteriophytochrome)
MSDVYNDDASDEIVEETRKQGEKMARLLYKTRGHNLVETMAKYHPMTSMVHMAPSSFEKAQISSALQWAMQAERAEIMGIVNEAYLEANAAAAKEDATPAQRVLKRVLGELKTKIEARGATVWPWAWKDEPVKTRTIADDDDDDDDMTVEQPPETKADPASND